MQRAWLAPVVLAVALVIQLTVLDGLSLPRGGVPDLVLVLVVALAIVGGPMRGMMAGFAAGLCTDIAPPGSPLIGQYALVFCLAGWAAGSLGRFTKRSPLRALAAAAVVVAGAEALAAALGKVLEPDQVSVAEIRRFLPVTIAYDLVLCPFALYLLILAMTTKASRSPATSALAGTGQLTVPARAAQARLKGRPHVPRLDPAAARAGDGWVGAPGRHPGSKPLARRGIQFYPGAGQPGSASGYAHQSRLPARPVKLDLSAGRRSDAAIGDIAGNGQGRRWQAGRHPGMMTGAGHQIRFGSELGGSAARQHAPAALASKPPRINFGRWLGGFAARQHAPAALAPKPPRIDFGRWLGGSAARRQEPVGPGRGPVRIDFRGRLGGSAARQYAPVGPGRTPPHIDFGRWLGGSAARQQEPVGPGRGPVRIDFRGRLGGSAARQYAPVGPGRTPPRINFSAHNGGSVSAGDAVRRSTPSRAGAAVPKLRLGASRSALAMTSRAPVRSVPTVHFHTAPAGIAHRPAAAPKFRRRSSLRLAPPTTGLVTGGAQHQTSFRSKRMTRGRSRFRLARRGLGMLGGGGLSTVRRPPARARKQPRFGYGRRSPLRFLTSRGLGGGWLAKRRAGRRSGAMLIGKRTGRPR